MDDNTNWYIFSCFWGSDDNTLSFIYGYAIQAKQGCNKPSKSDFELAGRRVVFQHEVISESVFNKRFTSDILQYAFGEVPVFWEQEIIQERLGHYTNSVVLSTVETHKDLYDRIDNSDQFIAQLLTLLSEETGFSFTDEKNYGRLGCFECVYAHEWFDSKRPFQINIIDSAPKTVGLELRRTTFFAKESHLLHLILRNRGSIVLDKIYFIPEKVNIYQLLDRGINYSQIEVWIFSADGAKTIHYENFNLLKEINFQSGIVTGSKVIQDALANRAIGKVVNWEKKLV